MRLVQAAAPVFARHETFHPRYGWFRKAYSCTTDDPTIFSRDDAPVRIGVGKNMVRSIRFWGLAAKLIEESTQTYSRRTSELIATDMGEAMFGTFGWDQYMEDPGTLWLLHWLLLAPRSRLPVWWLAFNEFNAIEFTDHDLESVVTMQLEMISEWRKPYTSSIKKDVSTLLRSYASTVRIKNICIDDLLDCPLRELKLIRYSDESKKYRFTFGIKATLPPEILVYAALDFIVRADANVKTVTLSRLAHESGAPGKIFKLSESEMVAILESAVDRFSSLNLISTAGATQLTWSDEPSKIAIEVLKNYYCSSNYISSDRLVADDNYH